MRKLVSLFAFAALAIVACSKKEVIDPPAPLSVVFEKDAAQGSVSYEPPKDSAILGSWKFGVYGYPSLHVSSMKIVFPTGVTLTGLEHLRFIIYKEDGSTEFVSGTGGVATNTYAFAPPRSLLVGQLYKIVLYADATDPALQLTVVPKLQITYSVNGGQTLIPTGEVPGQSIMFTAANVTPALASTLPAARNVYANQEVDVHAFTLTAIGQASRGKYFDFSMPNGSVVSQVKLYNGATHIGSGTVTGNTVRVTTDVVLPKDTAVTLTAKLVLKPITNESQSGVSNKLTLTKIGYQTNNGNSKTVSTSLSGNDVVSYKALFSMKRIPFSGVIDTTQQQTLYEGEITTYGDAVGFKQFGFNVLLSDIVGSGAFQDTIYVDSLAFFFGSNQVLNGVFLNALGQPITMITEADTKIYFVITSGAHELIVPAGQSIRFKLKGRAHGLKHPSDGDLVKVALAPDLTPVPAGYKFANRGVAGANMKLYNSPFSSSSAVPINTGWTDFSAGSAHSAAYTTSSGDFYSSYGFDVATDAQVLSQ